MFSRIQRFVLLVLFLASTSVGWAVKFQFQTDPAGATVQVVGPAEVLPRLKLASGRTPFELDLPRWTVPIEVSFSLPGYETATRSVNTKGPVAPITVRLEPLVRERSVAFETKPTGAEVVIGGAAVGTTPLTRVLRFERRSSAEAWSEVGVRLRRTDYQEEKLTFTAERMVPAVVVELGRIAETRDYQIVAADDRGTPIAGAAVAVNGTPSGQTDDKGIGRASLAFQRKDKAAPWPEFEVTLAVPNEYKPVVRRVGYAAPARLEFQLAPVTEVPVKRMFPGTESTPRGPKLVVDQTEAIGILDDRDLNSPAIELRPVTNFERRQAAAQAVNSFALTPDGRNLIYAVGATAEDGRFYSNLHSKSVQSPTSPVTQLTRGTRYVDCRPAMNWEENSTLVVFQSTRGVPETWDLSAIRVEANRVVGGVLQLTRDTRFNSGPTFVSEQQPVFFTSFDEGPRPEPRICSVRTDGSASTTLGETGEMLNFTQTGMLYLSRLDGQTGKRQIYSIGLDGQTFSTVINDDQFAQANCAWPALGPAGDLLLFVSDYAADEAGRKNNNIFLYDLRRGTVLQLTDNGSDDLMPKWSPTESGVFYFLSNRRGVYNVWRMNFRLAQ